MRDFLWLLPPGLTFGARGTFIGSSIDSGIGAGIGTGGGQGIMRFMWQPEPGAFA